LQRPNFSSKLLTGNHCNQNGIWTKCTSSSLSKADNYDACLAKCQADATCNHFTFYPAISNRHPILRGVNLCETFSGLCVGPVVTEDCATCKSGERACTAAGDPLCYQDYCVHGVNIVTLRDTTLAQCNAACTGNSTCTWYSFYIETSACVLLKSKATQDSEAKGICTSGQSGCPDQLICGDPQCCEGTTLGTSQTSTAQKCLNKCRQTEKCYWFSYRTSDSSCYLLSTCDPFAGPCIRGQRECTTVGKLN
jgi:hypothetical protein